MKLTLPIKQIKNITTIFLDDNSNFNVTEKINIILSPSLYWVKKVTIPVKFDFQAIKLLPALFDDMLPDDEDFEYILHKIEDKEYYIFAYNRASIIQLIEKSNIDIKLVSKIYFAQNEIKTTSVIIDEQNSIFLQNDILLKIPNNFVASEIKVDTLMHNIILSNTYFMINKSNFQALSYIETLKTSSVLIIISISFIVSYFNTNHNTNMIHGNQLKYKDLHHLPNTSYQLNSITKKLIKTDKRQLLIREYLSIATTIISSNSLSILSLYIDKKYLSLSVNSVNTDELLNQFKKRFKKIQHFTKKDLLTIKIEL